MFPLGSRPFSWETYATYLGKDQAEQPRQLCWLMFLRPQTCGLVILAIRMIHYFAEIKRDTIPAEQRTFLNFLAFNSFAPTFAQGPIERFKDFHEQVASCHEHRSPRDLAAGLGRIALGLGKGLIFVVYWPGLPFAHGDDIYRRPEEVRSYAVLFFFMYSQVVHIYLVFSGYTDVAVGLARLVGYRASENFRYFWMACSLIDLWCGGTSRFRSSCAITCSCRWYGGAGTWWPVCW